MAEITSIDIPPEPEKTVTLVVDVSNTESGGKLNVSILEGGGNLNVSILQFNAGLNNPDLQVSQVQGNKYSILFKPPKPALYRMVVKYNNENVSGSPLQLNLLPPNAKQVSLTKSPTGKIKTGQLIDIRLNSLLAGRGMFTATCKGKKLGDISVTVTRLGITNTHKVSFLPPQEDKYILDIYYSGVSIEGCPYKINLIPVKPNLVKCSQPVFPKGRNGPVEMDICTVGSGSAKLTATCAGSDGDKIPVNIEKVSKGNYHLKIDPPNKDDLLTLTVKYGGKEVQDSPFFIPIVKSEQVSPEVIEPAAAPVQITFGDLHIPETIHPTNEVWIDVDCPKTFQGSLTAEYMRQNEEGNFPTSVEEIESDGKYRVKFSPMFPDIYTLTLALGGEILPGGIFEINLLSKPCAKLVHYLSTCTPQNIEEQVVLKFDARKAGPGTMSALVNPSVSQAGCIECRVDLVDKENGIYHLSFTPDGAEVYTIDVYWCEKSIPCSPFSIPITYPWEVILRSPVNPQINHPVIVRADISKAGQGDLTASCSGRDYVTTNAEIQESDTPGNYNIYFHPTVADLYLLRVYFRGIEVKQSPIHVDLRGQVKGPILEGSVPVRAITNPYMILLYIIMYILILHNVPFIIYLLI